MDDVLDRILLGPDAVRCWTSHCFNSVGGVVQVHPIADEQAHVLEDGSLRIFASVGGQTIELILKPGEWAWKE